MPEESGILYVTCIEDAADPGRDLPMGDRLRWLPTEVLVARIGVFGLKWYGLRDRVASRFEGIAPRESLKWRQAYGFAMADLEACPLFSQGSALQEAARLTVCGMSVLADVVCHRWWELGVIYDQFLEASQ